MNVFIFQQNSTDTQNENENILSTNGIVTVSNARQYYDWLIDVLFTGPVMNISQSHQKSFILLCVIGSGVCVDMQFDMKQNYRNSTSHCNSIRVYTCNISPHMFQIPQNIHVLALLQYSEKKFKWTLMNF